jgi:MGT family glycosyltransferase
MSRFLFVTAPWAASVEPTVALGRELRNRGHEVAWVGSDGGRSARPGATSPLPATVALPPDLDRALTTTATARHGPATVKFVWQELLVPLGRAMVPDVHAAVRRFGPDVLIADQEAIAGAGVALARGLPWATLATTSAPFGDPWRELPGVERWTRRLLHDFQLEVGVPPARAAAVDPRFSDHLVVGFTTEALVGPADRFPDHFAFVGPVTGLQPASDPRRRKDRDPRVIIALGPLWTDQGGRFLHVTLEALTAMNVSPVVIAPAGPCAVAPVNVSIADRLPPRSRLGPADAVVSTAGHTTVCQSLGLGLPLVLAPVGAEQPVVANQVVRAGAGVRVTFDRASPDDLRAAVERVLTDPRFRRAAARVRDSFVDAGGAAAAADRLEALARPAAAAPGARPRLDARRCASTWN